MHASPAEKNMENIDEMIKDREKAKQIKEDINIAIKEKDKVISQLEMERRDLEKIRKDREKFVEDREIEIKNKFAGIENRMIVANQGLKELEEEGVRVGSDIENTLKMAVQRSLSLISRAEKLVEESEGIKRQGDTTIEVLGVIKEKLDENVAKNSEVEKNLLKLKSEVDIKNKKAEEKLLKAKQLAYWHKDPEATYKEE